MIPLALARPVSTALLALTLSVLGLFSLLSLPVSLLPDVERPRLVVTARAEGRSREEMLRGVTEPLERRLASLSGLSSMRSETRDGEARLVGVTSYRSDPDLVRIEAERLLDGATAFPPDEMSVAVSGGDAAPIVDVAVLGGASGAARTAYARKVALPELARLPGAGEVEVLGATPLTAVVTPRAADLAARQLTAADLLARLTLAGTPSAAGLARDGDSVRPLSLREPIRTLDELRGLALPVPEAGKRAVLGDVARAELLEVSDGTAFLRGDEPGVLLRVRRAPAANAVALAAQVRSSVSALASRSSSSGLRVLVVGDRSREVLGALAELGIAGGTGILLGTLLLWALLGSFRPTLSLSVVVPASLLTSFLAFHAFGVPLDVVSLAGLALAAGMLVDNSIVVTEAIESARARGSSQPALEGARQVAVAVVASCLATLVVFLPLLYLKGLARAFFGEQAFAVVASLSASLLLSLTLTPVLARRDAALSRGTEVARPTPGLSLYRSLLDRALGAPALTLLLALALTLGTALSLLALPRELMPRSAGRRVTVSYRLPPGLLPEAAVRRAAALARAVRESLSPADVEEALLVQGLPETGGLATSRADPSRGVVELTLASPAAARRALGTLRGLHPDDDARLAVRPQAGAVAELADPGEERYVLVASADEEGRLDALVARVASRVLSATGVRAQAEDLADAPFSRVLSWDEPRLLATGTSASALEEQVRSALGTTAAGRVDIPGAEPAVRVMPVEPHELALVPVRLTRVVPLASAGRIGHGPAPGRLVREEGRPSRRLVLPRLPAGWDAVRLARLAESVPRSAGESVRTAGEALEIERSFGELRLALVLALVLVALTIAAFYESAALPAVVLAAAPVAAGGAFALLWACGQSLNVLSMLGLLLLLGIVSNHTIVLVDRLEQLRRQGVPEEPALRQAGAERYRPVLLTTATTVLGMLPLALLGGEGVELRRALSLAVLGGLVTSTAASLLVVPVLHRAVERWRARSR